MKQFLFIKSATESVALPVSALATDQTTAHTVSLFFDTTKSGKDATTVVVLSVTSGKANDVVKSLTTQIPTSKQSVLLYDDVNDAFFTTNVTGVSSITTTESPSVTTGPTGLLVLAADQQGRWCMALTEMAEMGLLEVPTGLQAL